MPAQILSAGTEVTERVCCKVVTEHRGVLSGGAPSEKGAKPSSLPEAQRVPGSRGRYGAGRMPRCPHQDEGGQMGKNDQDVALAKLVGGP